MGVTGGVSLEDVGDGVTRITWNRELQELGHEAASTAVREVLERAFGELGQARVEAFVDPADLAATRIATWAGLQREGVMRDAVAVGDARADRVVFARVHTDAPVSGGRGFRAVLNSFLPRKRAIAQLLVRDLDGRVLLCNLTYKQDWDLPGGVVEVGESPRLAAEREVEEELALVVPAGPLVLTDWLPPWSGWDDAVCLVFDGGRHDASLAAGIVPQRREIRTARFCTPAEVHELCADFTARRIDTALANAEAGRCTFSESGRPV
ncbi:MAG: ATP/GTP-binding protein [uncultured Nocardioides sp.]|uniref:ATP/GTP-binding protein n=1 Tax=uncultured Nocardioides sp. TaxID=198441 RepID=A0A6J4MVL2_9ACTN|nr:MAG: ATP/GTP-binding protein [uncultured Nocardioides sp.]